MKSARHSKTGACFMLQFPFIWPCMAPPEFPARLLLAARIALLIVGLLDANIHSLFMELNNKDDSI